MLSSAGITTKASNQNSSRLLTENAEVHALGSTDAARDTITQKGFLHIRTGTINGIPAILLNEGSFMGIDVIVLLVNTVTDAPDFRVAALLSEAVSKIVPGIYCDIATMVKEANIKSSSWYRK